MGRIKKVAGPKHEATLSLDLSKFCSTAISLPLARLPSHLQTFPFKWPFPRGDLYHWIPLLDHFDLILESFIRAYELGNGPQIKSFTSRILIKGVSVTSNVAVGGMPMDELMAERLLPDGDRELVEIILNFSRMLVENCGNRSLYSSSERLGDLLNTTSISLLTTTLRLTCRLAQRYNASRQRGENANQNLNNALLASHYSINLDHVQRLAEPFIPTSSPYAIISPGSPTAKGKERMPEAGSAKLIKSTSTGEISTMADDTQGSVSKETNGNKSTGTEDTEWGDVWFTYYQPSSDSEESRAEPLQPALSTVPRKSTTPSKPSRLSTSEESTSPSSSMTTKPDPVPLSGVRTVLIPRSKLLTPLTSILGSILLGIPKEYHYELLNKLRTARAMMYGGKLSQALLTVRILAITNLAYIYSESQLQHKVLRADSDQPRRLQIVFQLADLIHPHSEEKKPTSLLLKTVALGGLEALSRHRSRAADVCTALSVNANHGVLLYVLRKAVAELSIEDPEQDSDELLEWHESLFSLLEALPTAAPRTADLLIGAGLMDILLAVLNLRTSRAERAHAKVLMFMNIIIHTVRDAFQAFSNAKGLDVITELIAWEVETSLEHAQSRSGLSTTFKTPLMDYEMPYFKQQTLRWLLKFVNHMMQHGNANFERLLRSLIDSASLLSAMSAIIGHAKVFGSNIWSGVVNVMSSFIHNEPTSYNVIAEAGLSKALLETISSSTFPSDGPPSPTMDSQRHLRIRKIGETDEIQISTGNEKPLIKDTTIHIARERSFVLARGILPATDAIITIPQAFGAICLNASGLEMFIRSSALDTFFEVFESADHVKAMSDEIDLPRLLGNSFDELVRHHPRLKPAVLRAMIVMLARIQRLCEARAPFEHQLANLWASDAAAEFVSSKPMLDDSANDSVLPPNGEVAVNGDTTTAENSADADSEQRPTTTTTEDPDTPTTVTYVDVVARFLVGFLDNFSLRAPFIEAGGVQFILDLATSRSLRYNFGDDSSSKQVARVVQMLAEQKPHLVLLPIMDRIFDNWGGVEPLLRHHPASPDASLFARYIFDPPKSDGESHDDILKPAISDDVTQSLAIIRTLCNILHQAFSLLPYFSRQNSTLFGQANLADVYVKLIERLGHLQSACVWEEGLLEAANYREVDWPSSIPDFEAWRASTENEKPASVSAVAKIHRAGHLPVDPFTRVTCRSGEWWTQHPLGMAAGKNRAMLRYLLGRVSLSITALFQSLGKALVPKRRLDSYLRQNASVVARALADILLAQLQYQPPRKASSALECYEYWSDIFDLSISRVMIDNAVERPHAQCLTIVLQAFRQNGGLAAVRELLEVCSEDHQSWTELEESPNPQTISAHKLVDEILAFYAQITNPKYIVESTQSQAMSTTDRERDRHHPQNFSPNQFMVELRMSVLPVVRRIWESHLVEQGSRQTVKPVIEVLRSVLEAEYEQGALKRADKLPLREVAQLKVFSVMADREAILKEKGFEASLAHEALFRCLNSREPAEEYCEMHTVYAMARHPVPQSETTLQPAVQSAEQTLVDQVAVEETRTQNSTPNSALGILTSTREPDLPAEVIAQPTSAMPESTLLPTSASSSAGENDDGARMAMSIDNLLNLTDANPRISTSTTPPQVLSPSQVPTVVTIEDLDEERNLVRLNIIDRVLDVLNLHDDLSFELSDLITTSATKGSGAVTMRKEIGETLVQSLISFQIEEDFRPVGKKIAAYANLLAIVIQGKDFYAATLPELIKNLAQILNFIKVFPESNGEGASPWVGQILLIVEKLLAEDVQPEQIRWTPPEEHEQPCNDDKVVDMLEPRVSLENKLRLFEIITELLPRIGKDESMATSVVRILVILTRYRQIANLLSEKRNLQRLFVMVKQLAGVNHHRFQSCFMLVLRHIVEDDETVRQIMGSEIEECFKARPSRPIDTTSYVRNMHHLVLRSPAIFVEATNAKVKLLRFDPSQRPQILTLKSSVEVDDETPLKVQDGNTSAELSNDKDTSEQNPAIKAAEANAGDSVSSKIIELKAPVVEHPDGVIHYLLSQLLVYKDVDDKEAGSNHRDPANDETPSSPTDIEMDGVSVMPPPPPPPPPPPISSDEGSEKKEDRTTFKAEEHPIYVYRCFLLQCLTELLSSYLRAKIEFINFSRKADPKASTPSKPRSNVLNYMLTTLLPVGTLEKLESVPHRKRAGTSDLAIAAIVALCSQTGRKSINSRRHSTLSEGPDSDLFFVRKFVLEHALRAFKDVHSMAEPLEVKYARLMCLAKLFGHLLDSQGILDPSSNESRAELFVYAEEMARIMYERNFISALTSSIAEIDLSVPSAKRAIKYVLRPLKTLTNSAIYLCENSTSPLVPGPANEDDISVASSASDFEDHREETPDLFQYSTLGMLEPGREEVSSSESANEDEDMYDDEYEGDDGMSFEEQMDHDGDDVVSDEEEDLPGAGRVEGLSGDIAMDVAVVIDGEDGTDDDAEDSEEMDETEDMEAVIDLDEDGDYDDDDEDEWQDEHDDERSGASSGDAAETRALSELDNGQHGTVGDIVSAAIRGHSAGLGRADFGDFEMDVDYFEDPIGDEDGDEDEEEDDEMGEDQVYEAEYDDDDMMPDAPWEWNSSMDHDQFDNPALVRSHQHQSRRIMNPWSMFPPSNEHVVHVPGYRSQRTWGSNRGAVDDGVNPLLQRSSSPRTSGLLRPPPRLGYAGPRLSVPDPSGEMSHLMHAIASGNPREGAVSFINSMFSGSGPATHRIAALDDHTGRVHLHFGDGNGTPVVHLPQDIRALLPGRRPDPEPSRFPRDESTQLTMFPYSSTIQRWYQEAHILYGLNFGEKAQRIVNSILKVLVPPALEEERARKEKQAEKAIQAIREIAEQAAREKEEQVAREATDAEASIASDQQATEATEPAMHQVSSPLDLEPATSEQVVNEQAVNEQATEAMEGVESTEADPGLPSQSSDQDRLAQASNVTEQSGPAPAQSERVMAIFQGREIDITGLDIDLEYLNALPDDLREEVLVGQLATHRSRAAAAGEDSTDISREFLDALPAEIRDELLQQESHDRRRQERDQARRHAAASSGGSAARAEDMDPASFLASLDPQLRSAVLLEQDEDVLSHLPASIAAEARALGTGRNMHPWEEITRLNRAAIPQASRSDHDTPAAKKEPRRQIIQILDKGGVATLLRLLFAPQKGNSQGLLNEILHNVSQNRQNRAEIINVLLSILQEGSIDAQSIDRSFVQLSLRAKLGATVKPPQPLKRQLTGPLPTLPTGEMTPIMVIQQCLETLVYLTLANPHVPLFFLTEHDSSNTKLKPNKKGKGKEPRAHKFALNGLLGLLDRKSIMESAGCMEQLSHLLESVTHPLTMLLRKDSPAIAEGSESQSQAIGQDQATTALTSTAPATLDTAPTELGEPDIDPATNPSTSSRQPPPSAIDNDIDSKDDPAVEDMIRKPRSLSPPVILEDSLRLVVHILAARECSAKTFRDTLGTISNLSAIPGTKKTFGNELIHQAQLLGRVICHDLEELLSQIQNAATGIDVQGMAFSRFSPSSSEPAKFLRVLTALDYLFDPKRKSAQESPPSEELQLEADFLSAAYEDATFTSLWNKLSDCLSCIRQREAMISVATILLPLVEALMVVCKNTSLNDPPTTKNLKDFAITSPAPESRMEDLFFRFTEDHRKILNDLVRHNPRLMSGTFSLLVKNPKVLEFDNKRNYFTRRLHTRTGDRQPQVPIQFSVLRDNVFLDSYRALHLTSADEMKFGKLSVRFRGEEGVDAGGVTREWFQAMSRQMFNPDYALFIPVASDRTTFHPSKRSGINEDFHLKYFKFIGRVIGKALYENRALDCHFSRAVYKRILGKPVSVKDMETLDLDYYKSLVWMLKNDISDIITETFSIEEDVFGKKQIVDLIENGRNVPVSEDNKQEYVQLVTEYRLTGSVQEQLEHFLGGFHDIIPAELIAIFNEQELELLISGLPDVDIDDWKANTEYHNYSASAPQIQWFWRAVRSFDKEERAKLLQFVTGTSKVPLNGFKELEGMNGFSRFNIHRDYGSKDRLPSSHTCFNQLDLPEYDNYETLRQRIYTAMTAGNEYFGFA